MHHLFTPNHVQLLNSCYPPTSALLTAGPDYSPNSQELSRLTYYASNHPGKLTKLGSELEKRLRTESRKAKAGNIRSRASLLISLSIFRSLATECRRDIALLSPSLVASVDVTIEAVPIDLEVVARAASVFIAWTTYTDGHLIGADSNMTRDYLSALRQFSHLSCSNVSDNEVRNRTRLVGFAALTGALNSEALYNNTVQFRAQVSTIMHPILVTLFQTEITTLNEQAAAVKEAPQSPYLAEFRTRPAIERRAASIHVHIDGDNGPSTADVSNASLRGLFSLLDHANGVQIGYIMQSSFDTLDKLQGWTSVDHCCWFAQKMAEWSQYQYRYAVPTWLVERLQQSQESTTATPLHGALAAMITSVFNSSTPLVNLSTSDILSNLVTLLLRRAAADPADPLLPALVQCISSLGRHVYYSDQIQDLAAELISRLEVIEVQGVLAKGKPGFIHTRTQAVRSILAGLLGLIQSANKTEDHPEEDSLKISGVAPPDTTKKDVSGNSRSSRRTRVPTDIWQNTLSLLCDSDYAVRADYSEALIFYLCREMPKHGDSTDADGVKRIRPLAEGPFQQAVNISALLHSSDYGIKFLNAIHGYIYILATTSSLGLTSSTPTSSPSHSTLGEPPHLNLLPATPDHSDTELQEQNSPSQSQANGRRSLSSPQGSRIRKTSVIQRLLERTPSKVTPTTSACLSDYTHILEIIVAVHEQIPVRGLLTGVPMLLALDAAIKIQDVEDLVTLHRVDAIKEVLAKAWLAVGKVWDLPDITQMAEKVLSSMPWPTKLPNIPQPDLNAHHLARNAVEFPSDRSASIPWEGVNAEAALLIITSSVSIQEATGLDKHGLLRRLSTKWTPDSALMDSVERSSGFENTVRGDGISPLLKISPALMHIENISMQSLARSARGVGVTDLREALEGRSSMSNTALARPPSISTLEHAPSSMGTDLGNLRLTQTRSRSRNKKHPATSGSGEVRDVLNRLGIGKQNGSLLKASFPTLQKSGQRAPPYKT